jgi:kynureninase
MHETISREFEQLDADDALASLRSEFDLHGTIYFDGNSLGPLPNRARQRIDDVVSRDWARGLIRSWNDNDWISLPRRVGAKLAPLLGAAPDEVIVGDSTSVCLFKLTAAALKCQERRKIITDEVNFPTDLYVLSGLQALLGNDIEIVRVPRHEIAAAIDADTALATLTHIDYKTAHMMDMKAVNDAAHAHGALVLWDLSHSAGAVNLRLAETNTDLAIGCTYKYLNGGPGAPAFCFVGTHLQKKLNPMLRGWMGHATPFALSPDYEPAPGIQSFACGTPEVLALSTVDASLDVFRNVVMDVVREKAVRMSELFIELVDTHCGRFGMEVASPRNAAERGSHVALRHEEGYAIMQALIARNIIGDFRAPDLMRFGFAPLYQRYTDISTTVKALYTIMETREWDCPEYRRRALVT